MKILGIIMTITFTTFSGIAINNYKVKQINYISLLILIGEKVLIYMQNTLPDTSEIKNRLRCDERLRNFDFTFDEKNIPLDLCYGNKVVEYFNSIGKFDDVTQIAITNEFLKEFRLLKEEYQQKYKSHHKLYIAFGLLSGVLFSVIII